MRSALAFAVACALLASCAHGPSHDHAALAASPPAAMEHGAPPADTRTLVAFPEPLRRHTLANMRDHVATLAAIQRALADGAYDEASQLAEHRLGLSSLEAHGAHHLAPFMPQPMQRMGTALHEAASRLALEASNAGATGDVRPALGALAQVTAQCVACHAAYRLQ